MNVVEVNLDKQPYNLRMQLTEGRRGEKTKWRISMTLTWLPNTREAEAWKDLSRTQRITAQQKKREALLEEADTRGL